MSEQMTAAVATDGQSFQQYLDVQSRFDRYTANNALLIMAQKPEAQKIGDYGYWRDQGAYVKRQERNSPILIMEPGKEYEREDGSTGTYYNAKKVYYISQTTAGGKIQQAQDSLNGAVREVREELGVILNPVKAEMIYQTRREDVQDFYDVWLFHADIDISEIKMQETEVISIRWVNRDGLIDMLHSGKLHPMIDYIEEMF